LSDDSLYIDKQLFNRVAEGDEAAFKELYQKYAPQLWPFLMKLTKSEDASDELIQEVFIRVWINRDQLDNIDNPRAWLYRIASNQAHNWFNKNILERKAAVKHQQNTPEDATIDTNLHLRQMMMAVNTAVSELPQQRRTIYRMNRDRGMKAAEIAQELNISVFTVKNTLAASVKFIRQRLEEQGYFTLLLIIFFTI
jgi:RNA polymerase sigma-70 factor (family 1)